MHEVSKKAEKANGKISKQGHGKGEVVKGYIDSDIGPNPTNGQRHRP